MTVEQRMSKTRTRLILDKPWYGVLSMHLNVAAADCETMQTDGTKLEYSPAFVETLSDAELSGVYAHEVLHCGLRHMYRLGGRDLTQWNEAADFAINQILIDDGFTLPSGALIDASFAGLSAEEIYSKRGSKPKPKDENGGGTGGMVPPPPPDAPQSNGKGNAPCPTGSFGPPPPDAQGDAKDGTKGTDGPPPPMSEKDWADVVETATAAVKKAGKLGGSIEREVTRARATDTDWRAILREFIEHTVPSDYSWTSPNRRHIANGVYLPGIVKENTAKLVVAVDTSGSIDAELLSSFGSELSTLIQDARPESVEVIYCNTRVQRTETFTPDDEFTLRAKGGGGTRFSPVFEHVAAADFPPSALIYFTDLDCYDCPAAVDYPVLWAIPEHVTRQPIFGTAVKLSRWS